MLFHIQTQNSLISTQIFPLNQLPLPANDYLRPLVQAASYQEEQVSWWEVSGVSYRWFIWLFLTWDRRWWWKLAWEDWEKTLLQERTDSRKGTFLCIFAFQVLLWPTSCLNYTCLHSSSNCTSYGKKEGQVIIKSRSQTWFSAQDHVRVELKPSKPITVLKANTFLGKMQLKFRLCFLSIELQKRIFPWDYHTDISQAHHVYMIQSQLRCQQRLSLHCEGKDDGTGHCEHCCSLSLIITSLPPLSPPFSFLQGME